MIQELPIEFKINDDVVQKTKALKLLGVTIDDYAIDGGEELFTEMPSVL